MKCVLEDTIIFTDEISEQSKDVAQLEESLDSIPSTTLPSTTLTGIRAGCTLISLLDGIGGHSFQLEFKIILVYGSNLRPA